MSPQGLFVKVLSRINFRIRSEDKASPKFGKTAESSTRSLEEKVRYSVISGWKARSANIMRRLLLRTT